MYSLYDLLNKKTYRYWLSAVECNSVINDFNNNHKTCLKKIVDIELSTLNSNSALQQSALGVVDA